MTSCCQRVTLFLAGVFVSWSCVGETHGVGDQLFDVRGTVVDTGGGRVGDALVVLINSGPDVAVDWGRAEDHPGAFVTRTDMRGVFVLAEVPGASYYLYARSGNGQAHVRRIGFHYDPPPPYDVHLSMTEVEGTVYWPDGRTPVAGAIVGLDYDFFMTRTDEHGKFRFTGVEPKAYAVFARARLPLTLRDVAAAEAFAKATRRRVFDSVTQGFEEIVVESKVTVEPNGSSQLTILLHGGVVQGVVRTDTATPAVGVLVTGGRRARITDHAGRFELTHVPVGSCSLAVQGRNNEFRRTTVNVVPGGDPTRVEITLYPFRPQVTFHFATPNRDVLANEGIRRVWRRYGHGMGGVHGLGGLKTDDHGRWQDQWMDSGAQDYLFFSATFGYAEQTVVIGEGVREVHHQITLTPGGSICGIARDQLTGAPLGGVVVMPIRVGADGLGDSQSLWNGLMGGLHNRLVSGYPITQVSRDGDGTFCLRNLAPGTYRLFNTGVWLGEEFTLEDAEDVSGVEIVVATPLAQRWVVGRVLGPDNAPVANTEVTFIIDHVGPMTGPYGPLDGVPRRAVTDELGLFRVGPLQAREYWLSAWTPGHRSKSEPIDVTTESIDAGDLQLVPVEGW